MLNHDKGCEALKGIDRELLEDLDRHLRGAQGDAPPTVPDAPNTFTVRADVSGVLEAIQFAATSMSATADRIEQLESQSQASDAANRELEEQNRQLVIQLGEVTQERDATHASLAAEKERLQRLEALAAHHISRANALEQELAASQADIAKVIELVQNVFGTLREDASFRSENPTAS